MSNALHNTTRIARLIWSGRLHRAAEISEQDQLNAAWWGRLITSYLTRRLVRNAFWNWQQGNFSAAWADFGMADRVVSPSQLDWLIAQKSRLVEETIRSSDQMLASGQAATVAAALSSLKNQKVLDWRADRSLQAAELICESERLARQGQWQAAISRLAQVEHQRADLPYIAGRLNACRKACREHGELTQKLRQAICGNRLDAAKNIAEQVLAISPEDSTARAVRKTLDRNKSGDVDTNTRPHDTSGISFSHSKSETKPIIIPAAAEKAAALPASPRIENFLMWVDGVGGFLVCAGPTINLGGYVDQPGVDIPIQADLRRRHLKIELRHDQFALHPIGPVKLADRPLHEATILQADQVIELTGQVKLRFRQSHPLSSSARIDFVSPHRTVPWSDAVLLLADTLIIGPNRQNHVYCPNLKNDLILFRRRGELFVRSESPLRIDGRLMGSSAAIQSDSSVCGEDFSIKLEPVVERAKC